MSFRAYADKWAEQRELAPVTRDLYRPLPGKHPAAFADADLDEITAPRANRGPDDRGQSISAEAYRLLKAVMKAAADDELIPCNPCRPKSRRGLPGPSLSDSPRPSTSGRLL
ncbi:hypothetical protein [Streptomyces sp. NPDC047079]|uniref:hypothetical protein n=1 Tax=Streptomyces sp. NPDC047079 TaxID=3154607 RepID=UPI0034059CCB